MLTKDHIQSIVFFSLLAISALIVLLMLWPFLSALALSFLFAILFYPLYTRLHKKLGNESLASLLTILCVILIIVIPLSLVGFKIFNQALELYNAYVNSESGSVSPLDTLTSLLQGEIQRFVPSFNIDLSFLKTQALDWLLEHMGGIFSGIFRLGLGLFIMTVGLFYLLKQGKKLKNLIRSASPLPEEQNDKIISQLEKTVNSVVKGSLLVAGIQGLISAIGYTIFGVPQAALWGAVTAVAALVPGVGTALVLLPAILYLYVSGSSLMALGLLLWGVLAVGLIDNFLGPVLIGRGLKVNPLLTLISVLGGFNVFGPIGFLIGPLFLSLFITMFNLYLDFLKSHD